LCELKSPKYWELATERFKEHFPQGMKERRNALTVSDEKVMFEVVSDEDSNVQMFKCYYPAGNFPPRATLQ
jgi:hypothetical protein